MITRIHPARAPLTHRRAEILVGLVQLGLEYCTAIGHRETAQYFRETVPRLRDFELHEALDTLIDLRNSRTPRTRKDR